MELASQIYEFNSITGDIDAGKIKEAAYSIADTIKHNGSIYICGNGGSGSSANLFASLLLQTGFSLNHRINAISLNSNMVTISALACQYGYQEIFKRQLQVLANKNDLLIVISGSGNSPNILAGVKTAQEMGLTVIGLTGLTGGKLKGLIDKILFAPSDNIPQIENIHYIYIYSIIHWLYKYLDYPGYLDSLRRLILTISEKLIFLIKNELLRAGRERNTIYLIGNGISSATCQHFTNDLAKKGSEHIVINLGYRLKAIALTEPMSFLTAIANDISLEEIFVESLKFDSRENDLLIVLSSAPPHENIIRAVRYAKEKRLRTITISGTDSGALEQFSDIYCGVKSNQTDLVETVLVFICHYLAEALNEELDNQMKQESLSV